MIKHQEDLKKKRADEKKQIEIQRYRSVPLFGIKKHGTKNCWNPDRQ